MADQDFVLAPATESVSVSIALEPAFNAIDTLLLLSHPEQRSGFSAWITETAARLPADLKHSLSLMLLSCGSVAEPSRSWPSFPAFIDNLAAQDPVALRDKSIEWISREADGLQPPDHDTLLSNKQVYLDFIEQYYIKQAAKHEKEMDFDPTVYGEVHDLYNNPVGTQKWMVDTLRTLWHDYLAPEWERTLPMLQESVDAFQQLDYSHMTALEAIRVVTGRDLSGIWDEWRQEIVFVPSPHIGPYVTRFDGPDGRKSWILFGARLPEGARVSSPALSRSELQDRLSALADDTRLQILELLTQHDELCAQDMIEILELSQSAASRHLRQLTATGYLLERRREVAKCYSLNPMRVDDTLRALKRFLRAK
jgi:DNA-binding transcriptional ArsR family regulator